jgi:hypothetical protein
MMDLINNTLGDDYIIDEDFNVLIKNKKIAYVGPAPNLQGLAMGSYIDSHDIVMRIGDPPVKFMGQTGKEMDYGSRTDILVHSFNVHDRDHLNQDLGWVRDCKYLFQPMVRSAETPDQEAWFEHVGVPVYNVPDHHIKSDDHWNKGKPGHLYDYLGSLPNTGFIGILTLLNYEIESLYITGMTFYNMGGWDKEGSCYFDEWYEQLKCKKYGLNESSLHNPMVDIKHFRNILSLKKHRDKIILDDYLMKYFGDLYE